jgi:hypothetical protein
VHERRRREGPEATSARGDVEQPRPQPPSLEWASATGNAAVARLARSVMIDEMDVTGPPEAPVEEEKESDHPSRWQLLAEDAQSLVGGGSEAEGHTPDMLPPGGHAPIEEEERY